MGTSEILILVAEVLGVVALGVVIGYIWAKKTNKNNVQTNSQSQQDSKLLNEIQKKLEAKENEIKNLISEKNKLSELVNSKSNSSDNGEKESLIRKLNDEKKKVSDLESQIKQIMSSANGDARYEELKKATDAQIKKLKEELDDAEDDLVDLKSKHKKEIAKKDDEIEELEDSNKKLTADVEKLTEDNKRQQEDISLKKTSINFVTEVLTANPVNIDPAKAEAVRKMAEFIDSQLYSCLKNTPVYKPEYLKSQEFEDLFDVELRKWIISKKKTWLSGKTTIALVGEFSAGKTSIVNRILSQDNKDVPLLPTSMKATTAVPTYITGGSATTTYSIFTPDNQRKTITETTFKKVSKEVLDEVKGVSSLIQYFVMEYNNPLLQGISVLDTPGFSSGDKEDAERTIEVINECDALFWVFDVNAGTVNKQSIDLIKTHLRKPLYVVINKCDTKAQSEVASVENLIKNTLQSNGVNVRGFIQFSQQAPLSAIMNPIKEASSQKENFDYIDYIKTVIENPVGWAKNWMGDALKNYKDLNKKGEEHSDIYLNYFKNLSNAAGTAKSIPHWETHFFSKDCYEMTSYEFNNLKGQLDYIVSGTSELYKCFPSHCDEMKSVAEAYGRYVEYKAEYEKLKACLDEFNRLKKNL